MMGTRTRLGTLGLGMALAGTLLVATSAAAFELTGVWQGKISCSGILEGHPRKVVKSPSTMLVNESDGLHISVRDLKREIFEKARRGGLKLYVARSKARSFESMLVPYVNSPSICADGGLARRLVSGQFVSRRMIYASTNAPKVIPDTSVSLDKSSSNF